MRWNKVMLTVGLCSSLLLTACTSEVESQEEHQNHTEQQSIGDIREETSGKEQKPKFLANKTEDLQSLYLAVAQHQELLEYIPCYCGCGESVNHKNNYDCFIYENKPSGAVVWDDHATKCGVCLKIANEAINDFTQGKSVKEIRHIIDEKYKNGYAKPTPTPEV